jgi:hypothetical protein
MKNKTSFPTANHKDHFLYENLPFINPEHGELHAIEWAFVIDINLLPPVDEDHNDYTTSPSYYLQVTHSGEVRGVTHDYNEHEDYFSVAADNSDVIFLKMFANQYPRSTPTLLTVLGYRKLRMTQLKKQLDQARNLEDS